MYPVIILKIIIRKGFSTNDGRNGIHMSTILHHVCISVYVNDVLIYHALNYLTL